MKKFIELYNDILPLSLVNEIERICLSEPILPYNYVNNITDISPKYQPGISHVFHSPDTLCYPSEFTYIFYSILYALSIKKNFIIQEIFTGRVFTHFPSTNPGQDTIHTDIPVSHWVCLYYINDSEGDTVFFDDHENEIKRVSPKKGQIAFFDGSIKHCSTRPANITRSVINFDFIGEKLG